MLLTISTTHRPATDMGYLFGKHPDRFQTFEISGGKAHVFYPEASEEKCTIALVTDINQVDLTRAKKGQKEPQQDHYVNDRPYAASSILASAMNKVFRSAAAGVCKDKPELAETKMPLTAAMPTAPTGQGRDTIKKMFEPLRYEVETEGFLLDPEHPEWGNSPYTRLTLKKTATVRELLSHLYVILPVLDGEKHYWVGDDEVQKLLRFGEGWLQEHPQKEAISQRFLKNQRGLVRDALEQLPNPGAEENQDEREQKERNEDRLERPMKLAEQRTEAVRKALHEAGAKKVLDLGCGEGRLLLALARDRQIQAITGVETSHRSLEIAKRRLQRANTQDQDRVQLLHGSLTYRDGRLAGYDAGVAMEVIEHIDPPRLEAFEDAVFRHAQPKTVIVTTPNREYNPVFGMQEGKLRHRDHRFEWTRAELKEWAEGAAGRNGYSVKIEGIGPEDQDAGHPTQMAVFTKNP